MEADVAGARTLPPEAFTSREFAERELATIFRHEWQLVPQLTTANDARTLADAVRLRGGRAPFTLLDRPLFLQRDWEGTLRAFPNVCTHAWHTLVQGPERERAIVCPQHGRKFDTQGACQSQPGFDGVADFPRAEDSLRALPSADWGDLLFVALDKPRAPLADVLAPVRESLGALPFDKLVRKPQPHESRELEGNWKLHAWNYMDQLHIPWVHARPGGLADRVDLASYTTELHGHAALQWAYARDPAHGFDPALLPARFRSGGKRVFALWWFVFPNLTLNFYPWGLSVNAYLPIPGKPTRTRFVWHQWSWDEEKHDRRDDVWMMKAVDDEDVDALAQVARGVASGLAARGRFAPSEIGPHWFHRLVSESVR